MSKSITLWDIAKRNAEIDAAEESSSLTEGKYLAKLINDLQSEVYLLKERVRKMEKAFNG
jgi:hypothetical protein